MEISQEGRPKGVGRNKGLTKAKEGEECRDGHTRLAMAREDDECQDGHIRLATAQVAVGQECQDDHTRLAMATPAQVGQEC